MKKYIGFLILVLTSAAGVFYGLKALNPSPGKITIEEIKSSQEQYYPLARFLPYENEYLKMEYVGPAKLKVIVKQETNVKSFVEQFAQLHGKDISNHTVHIE